MKKETLFHTPMTTPEKTHIRHTALWMFGLMAVGCLLTVWLTPQWNEICAQNDLEMIILGGMLMVIAVPFHIIAGCRRMKKHRWRRLFYIGSVLNIVAVSLFEAAYYTRIGVAPLDAGELLTAAGLPLFFGFLCMACFILFTHAIAVLPLMIGGLGLAGIVTCIVFWVQAGHTADAILWSFMLFTLVNVLIVLVAFVFAAGEISMIYGGTEDESAEQNLLNSVSHAKLSIENASEDPDHTDTGKEDALEADRSSDAKWGWLRFLSFASFGIFMIVGAIVLLILMLIGGDCDCDCGDCCDCDCGDCCDCCDFDGCKSKNSKRKRYK